MGVNEQAEFNYAPTNIVSVISEAILTANRTD